MSKNNHNHNTAENESTALVPLSNGLTLSEEMIGQLEQSESLAEITSEDRLLAHECFNVKFTFF